MDQQLRIQQLTTALADSTELIRELEKEIRRLRAMLQERIASESALKEKLGHTAETPDGNLCLREQ